MRRLLRAAGADGLTAAQLAARMSAQAPPCAGAGSAGAGAAAPADTPHAGLEAAQVGARAAGLGQDPASQNPNTNSVCAAALLRVLRASGLARHAPAFSSWVTVAAEHAGCYLVEPLALTPHPSAAPAAAPASEAAPPAPASAQAGDANPADGSISNLAAGHAPSPALLQPLASAAAGGSTPATATAAAVSADAPEALEVLAAGAGPTTGTVAAESVRVPRLVPWEGQAGGAAPAGPNPDPMATADEGLGMRTLAAVAPVVPAPSAAAQTVAQSHEVGASAEQACAAAAPSPNPDAGGAALLVPWRDHRGRLVEGMWQSLVHRALSVVVRHPGAPVGRPYFYVTLLVSPKNAARCAGPVLLVRALGAPSGRPFYYLALLQAVRSAEAVLLVRARTSHMQGDGSNLPDMIATASSLCWHRAAAALLIVCKKMATNPYYTS